MTEAGIADRELRGLVIERSTLRRMVEWAAATDDFTEFHYDAEAAAARGFRGPVVHGPFKAALLGRVLESNFGAAGVVTRFACRYLAPDIVGGRLVAGGRVVAVDGRTLSCELWIEDDDGRVTVRAEAELVLEEPR